MKPDGTMAARPGTGSSLSFRNDSGTIRAPAARDDAAASASLHDRRGRGGARIGLIFNRVAHGNAARGGALPDLASNMDWAAPRTLAELMDTLRRFGERGIDVLIVDGGDGTIRDILTIASECFPDGMPALAIVPSGKTNALANDLGIPLDWSVVDAIEAIASGRIEQRAPIEVSRDDAGTPMLRGFLLGAGAFVKGTAIAQDAHRLGAFRGIAVGLSLAAAITQTIFAGRANHWRQGDRMKIDLGDGRRVAKSLYLLLASTLERLPLGIKPFGRVRSGLKLLGVDAPPRHMVFAVPPLLAGSESPWLDRFGYHRAAVDRVSVSLDTNFILDGESYAGGDLVIARGSPIDFIVP